MAKVLYTATATVHGGRMEGRGRTSDGALEVELRSPPELGGPGGGTNPEQLFAVGYAACFDSALATVARRQQLDLGEAEIEAHVDLMSTERRGFAIGVRLDVRLPRIEDAEQARRIVGSAHAVCPYSSATRGNIEVVLTANGRPV